MQASRSFVRDTRSGFLGIRRPIDDSLLPLSLLACHLPPVCSSVCPLTRRQREFCRDLFYAANTTYNERKERLTLEEEIKINEVQRKLWAVRWRER